jgi:hypothetical protein
MAAASAASPLRRTRQCSRPGCAEPAAATLAYRYDLSSVWIDELAPEREPHRYDLCRLHADRCRPPNGWHLEDRRMALEALSVLDRLAG